MKLQTRLSIGLIFIFCLLLTTTYAQTIPQNPNLTDAKGLRQGKWTILFDKGFLVVQEKAKMEYYRLITYRDGKPMGKVGDYYKNGNLQMLADSMIVEEPQPILHGTVLFYRIDGSKELMQKYVQGTPVEQVAYNATGSKDEDNWLSLLDKGARAMQAGNYPEAQPYLEKACMLTEKEFGKEHLNYLTALNNLGLLYSYQGLYAKAEPLFIEAKEIQAKTLGKEHSVYAKALNNLGLLYSYQGLYAKAEPLYLEAKEIFTKALGKEHPDYATSLNSLADLYTDQSLYDKAEPLYLEAKEIFTKALGKEHPDYAMSLNSLAILYQNQGLYTKAEPLIIEAKEIRAKVLGKEHPDYAMSLNNLASLYYDQGFYNKAEPLFLEIKEIQAKVLGKEHPDYAASLNNLASLYENQGLYAKAEPLIIEAKEIAIKTLGKEHPHYATSLNNLAKIYMSQGLYAKAEPLYLEAKEIRAKVLGKEHPEYANSLNNLASLYKAQGLYTKAESLCLEAKEITAKALGKEHPDYAASLNNLATLYMHQGLYAKPEPLYIEAKEIILKILGKEHPHYAVTLTSLANLYRNQGLYTKAEPLYQDALQNKLNQIQSLLPTLSEKERQGYIQSIQKFFFSYYNFTLAYYPQKPAIAGDLFNLQLSIKGLLFESSQKMRQQIFASQDSKLIELYETWKAKRTALNQAFQLPIAEREKKGIDIKQIAQEANDLERGLSQRSELFAQATDKTRYTWQAVQKQLKPNEALVEMIRIAKYDFKTQKIADTVYLALIIRPDTKLQPEMIVLPNGKDLEGKYLNYYRNAIKYQKEDKFSYTHFWQSLGLGKGIKKVYFSPDGVYHQINLLTLKNPNTGKYLSENIDIQLLSNSKDLIKYAQKPSQLNKNFQAYQVHLFGYPAYSSPLAPKGGTIEKIDSTQKSPFEGGRGMSVKLDTAQRFLNADGKVASLPGTKTEVENIRQICQNKQIQNFAYLDTQASEEAIKKLQNPDILHIATHGFFLADLPESEEKGIGFSIENRQKLQENPLLRCGLLLSNAEKGLKGEITEGEDGVLTAQEAMNLNLDKTDLVVMSACETGLGEISNGEGVYGLQRSFQQAGAKTILMSLWTVNDEATQMMMTLFYQNLVQGKPKREAFKNAQNELKKKFPQPYYWGAFVMVGE